MTALAGKRLVVTRAANQAEGLCLALEEAGAQVIRCPTIEVTSPESSASLDAALARLDAYRWLAFTSANGVRAVLSRMSESGQSPAQLDGARVAAVGASTARTLESCGIRPAFVPDVERSRALAAGLTPVEGERILLARADIADPSLADILRRRGAAEVDDIVAYRTVLLQPSPEALEELRRGVDGITFTSPSTVRGFLRIGAEWRDLLKGVVVASLGSVTTEAARREGMRIDAEAVERSMNGLVDALAEAFASRAGDVDRESSW